MPAYTTLSKRGFDLAAGPSLRDRFDAILHDPYCPDTNLNGFINIGTAENVIKI